MGSLESTSQTLTRGAQTLLSAQQAAAEAAGAARADGCEVDDDGTAHPPPVAEPTISGIPIVVETLRQQALADAHQEAAALAARHTTQIRARLTEAATADADVASTLAAITLPDAAASAAVETVQTVAGAPLGSPTPGLRLAFPADWRLADQLRPLDPADWTRLVAGSTGLPVFASSQMSGKEFNRTGYYGGGAVIGPDGREYPLVAPQVYVDGVPYGGDAEGGGNRIVDLDGADDGWHVVGQTSSIDTLTPVGTGTKVASGLAVAGGLPAPNDNTPSRLDLRENVQTNAAGFPIYDGGPGDADSHTTDRLGKPFGGGRQPHQIGTVSAMTHPTSRHYRRALLVATIAAVAPVLAGCGGSGSDPTASGSPSPSTSSSSSPSTDLDPAQLSAETETGSAATFSDRELCANGSDYYYLLALFSGRIAPQVPLDGPVVETGLTRIVHLAEAMVDQVPAAQKKNARGAVKTFQVALVEGRKVDFVSDTTAGFLEHLGPKVQQYIPGNAALLQNLSTTCAPKYVSFGTKLAPPI